MNKLAIGVLSAAALAVAGGLATSYYVGEKIQDAFEQTADNWSVEDGFTVRVLNYDRGVLGSQAQTLWSFANEDDTYDITVTHDIVHGPWPMGKAAKIVSRFLLPDDSDPQLIEALQKRAPLEWTITSDWAGHTQHVMFSPNFSTSFEDGSSLTWGGLQAEWTLSALHDSTKGFVRMPVLRVKVEDGSRLDVEDTEVTFDSHIPEGYSFWIGPSAMKVGLLSMQDTETESQLKLQRLELTTTTDLQDSLVQTGLDSHIAHLENDGFALDNLALQLRFNRINADWLNQVMQWVQAGSNTQQMDWLRSLPQLLAGKPEIAIPRLSMDSASGPLSLSAHIAYTGEQPGAFNPGDLEGQLRTSLPMPLLVQLLESKVRNDYLTLLEQMNHELDEQELQAAVEDGVDKRLQALIEQGVVQQQGEMVETSLDFGQGRFSLNQQPKTLQQLLGIGSVL